MLGRTDSYTYKSLKDYNKDIYDLIKYTPIYKRIEDASPKVLSNFCKPHSMRSINTEKILKNYAMNKKIQIHY